MKKLSSILTTFFRIACIATFTTTTFAEEFLGGIEGNLSVNQGAANYNIPVEVPRGQRFKTKTQY